VRVSSERLPPGRTKSRGSRFAFAAELDTVIRRRLPGFLGESDEEARSYLAKSFRDEIGLVNASWQDWKAALFEDPRPE
jgi:hypothetical protein